MAKKSRFRHTPLSAAQIRLVQISSDLDQPTECSIQVYNLSEAPKYTCLSYMWRRTPTDTEQHPIRLNGKAHKIGQNLADFLYVAPRKYPDVYFWIDALCIDQKNLEERSDQVRRMGQIYSDAVRTVAWLGQSDGAENLQFHNQSWRPRVARRSSGMSPQETAIFNQIVQHDYWTRTWIVQEQRFSQNMEILMGEVRLSASRLIELNDLASRLVRLYGRERSQVEPFRLATKSLLLGDRTEKLPMISLLKLHHKTSCSDVRDKIHALLAMAIEGSEIEIDYTTTRVDLVLRTIWACRDTFCMCLSSMLFRTLGMDRVDEDLQNLPHPFLEILVGCYHHEKQVTTHSVLRTCKCKDQGSFDDEGSKPQKGITLCLRAICGFTTGAHMLLGSKSVIHWGSNFPPMTLRWPPLVNVRHAKGERFETTVSISFTPMSLFEFTSASVTVMSYRERYAPKPGEHGDNCQRAAKNIFYRVLGHGLCADDSSVLDSST